MLSSGVRQFADLDAALFHDTISLHNTPSGVRQFADLDAALFHDTISLHNTQFLALGCFLLLDIFQVIECGLAIDR